MTGTPAHPQPAPLPGPRWTRRLAILAACTFALFWCLRLLTSLLHNRCLAPGDPPAKQAQTCSHSIFLDRLFQNQADNRELARAWFQRGRALAELDRPAEAARDFRETLRLLGIGRGFDATQDLATTSESAQSLFAAGQGPDPEGKAYSLWVEVLLKNRQGLAAQPK